MIIILVQKIAPYRLEKASKVAKYALILGEDEISSNKITIKNLDTSKQKTVSKEDIEKEIV